MGSRADSPSPRPRVSPRTLLVWLLKLGVTVALLAWLLRRPEIADGLLRPQRLHGGWLAAGVLCGGLSQVFAALRWRAALGAGGLSAPFSVLLRLTLAGAAAGYLSIGSLGNDAVRLALAARRFPRKKAALAASIGLDHLSAFPGFVLLSLPALGFLGGEHWQARGLWTAFGVALAGFFGVGLTLRIFFPALHDRVWHFVVNRDTLGGFAKASCWSVPMLLFYYAVFFCAARALSVDVPAAGFTGAALAADVVSSLPVTIAGLGVREKVFETLLGRWHGVAPADAVALSLTGFALLLLWAAAGAVCLLTEPVAQQPSSPEPDSP